MSSYLPTVNPDLLSSYGNVGRYEEMEKIHLAVWMVQINQNDGGSVRNDLEKW